MLYVTVSAGHLFQRCLEFLLHLRQLRIGFALGDDPRMIGVCSLRQPEGSFQLTNPYVGSLELSAQIGDLGGQSGRCARSPILRQVRARRHLDRLSAARANSALLVLRIPRIVTTQSRPKVTA